MIAESMNLKTTKQKNTENAHTYSKTIVMASIYYLKLMLRD